MEESKQLPQLLSLYPDPSQVEKTEVEIIAVHGLETSFPKSFIAYEQAEEQTGRAVNWLQDPDMLPQVVPQAHIWAYRYSANCYSDNAQEVDLNGLADCFLDALTSKIASSGERRLIFIGSCFGGLVIAQALNGAASHHDGRYQSILEGTTAIVFLGTPFRGTAVASLTQWIASLNDFLGKETSLTLLNNLRAEDSHLDDVVQTFAQNVLSHQIHIRCFYETRKIQLQNKSSLYRIFENVTGPIILVPKESACLDGHDRMPLEATHSMINKYCGPNDGSFMLVSESINHLAKNASIVKKLSEAEKGCLHALASRYREDKDRNRKRIHGTCHWALDHENFVSWRNEHSQVLWISADPGCGKSVLSRAIIDERLDIAEGASGVICYFFFKEDDPRRRASSDGLSSLLHQLFMQKPLLLKHAVTAYNIHKDQLRSIFNTLLDVLCTALSDTDANKVTFLLDALDECDKQFRNEIAHFVSISSTLGAKVVLTSRPYVDVENTFRLDTMKMINLDGLQESSKISAEIDLVIDHEIQCISDDRRHPFDPAIQDALIYKLKSFSHRTYLWLHLILDVIKESLESTRSSLESLVDELPSTVDHAYERILGRIDIRLRKQAYRTLQLIVAARRPLSMREMNTALALDACLMAKETCTSYHNLDLPQEQAFQDKLRNLCGLFVHVVDSKIYLIHQTAREFLIKTNSTRSGSDNPESRLGPWKGALAEDDSNRVMVDICMSYLLLDELDRPVKEETWFQKLSQKDKHSTPEGSEPSNPDSESRELLDDKLRKEELEVDLLQNPQDGLLPYAGEYWIYHFKHARANEDAVLVKQVLSVCKIDSNRFLRWSRSLWDLRPEYGDTYKNSAALMIASYFDIGAIVSHTLSQSGVEINIRDKQGNSPLCVAASLGHLNIVTQLLSRSDIQVDIKNDDEDTPLSLAAVENYYDVCECLLRVGKATVNTLNHHKSSPLSLAAEYGNAELVKLLLSSKTNRINRRDALGSTPLLHAAARGHTEIVELLLALVDIDINKHNSSGHTPFSSAAKGGHLQIVQMLLARREISLSTQFDTSFKKTLLFCAVQGGNPDIVRMIRDRTMAEINVPDSFGRTPLGEAAGMGNLPVVVILLETEGIDINYCPIPNLKSPLMSAVKSRHNEIVRVLVRRDELKINHQDYFDQTALHYAASSGSTEIAHWLLSRHDIDVNTQGGFGEAPLHVAAENGHLNVIELLTNKDGINVNLQKDQGSTPVLERSKEEIDKWVENLFSQHGLTRGPDDGDTPLKVAIKKNSVSIVAHFLARRDVDVNSQGEWHRNTPLHEAILKGSGSIIKMLLNSVDIEVNRQNRRGDTPFHLIASKGYGNAVAYLLERKHFDVTIKNTEGNTAQDLAEKVRDEASSASEEHREELSQLESLEARCDSMVKLLQEASSSSQRDI